jgi:acetyl-CoA acyltransferase
MRRVFIAGGSTTQFLGKGNPAFIWKKHSEYGKRDNPNLRDMITSTIRSTLQETGISASLVDRTYVGNFAGELFNQQGHLGAAVATADPGLMHKPSMRIEGACASGGLAAAAAIDALKGGGANLCLVVGVEQQTTADARTGGTYLARAADYPRQSGIDDFTFPCLLAQRTKHYAAAFPHFHVDDLCPIVAKAYSNGNKNPKAHMHTCKVDADAARASDTNPLFLSNQEYRAFMRLRDCSQVSDGGSAILLASEAGLREAGIRESDCVEIVGAEYGCGDLYTDATDPSVLDTAKAVVGRLYQRTGLSIDDIQVAEVHDCFSIAELLMYEAIGLAEHGRGADVCKDGVTSLDGSLPINTGGGLMAFGHPVGATGVKQLHEIYRQMKGQCGDYQLVRRPELGLTVNRGGDDKTIVAMALKNCV